MGWQRTKWLGILLVIGTGLACASQDPAEIKVNLAFSGSNPFKDPDLVDIVFLISNTNDADQKVVFPPRCADPDNLLAKGCGFEPSTSEFRLSPDPIAKDATISVTVTGRDADGATLFTGTSSPFTNSADEPAVTVTVSSS